MTAQNAVPRAGFQSLSNLQQHLLGVLAPQQLVKETQACEGEAEGTERLQ